jgi:hypothetical protein
MYGGIVKLCRRARQLPTFRGVLIFKVKQIVYSLTLNMNLPNAGNHSSKDKSHILQHLTKDIFIPKEIEYTGVLINP